MFNLYSKLTTAFAAFAIIFSTGVSAQCEWDASSNYGDLTPASSGEVALTNYAYAGESYSISMTAGETYLLSTLANSTDTQLTLFDSSDDAVVAYNDDFGVPQSYIEYTAVSSGVYNLLLNYYPCGSGTTNTVLSVTWVSTDSCDDLEACNFDLQGVCTYADAGFDCDGICLVGVAVAYASGNYCNEHSFTITDCDDNVLAEMTSGCNGFSACLVLPDAYSVNMLDTYSDGWDGASLTVAGVSYTSENVYQVGACPVYGCMDTTAVNFNALATVDATSSEDATSLCTFGIAGCMDATACNYSDAATADDGSCVAADPGFDCNGDCLGATVVAYYDADGDGYTAGDATTACQTCEVGVLSIFEADELSEFGGIDNMLGSGNWADSGNGYIYHGYAVGDQDSRIFATIDLTSYDASYVPMLSYYQAFNYLSYQPANGSSVEVSTDGGVTWVQLANGDQSEASGYFEFIQIDLAAYASTSFMIGFHYTGNDAHNWFVDDVSVSINDIVCSLPEGMSETSLGEDCDDDDASASENLGCGCGAGTGCLPIVVDCDTETSGLFTNVSNGLEEWTFLGEEGSILEITLSGIVEANWDVLTINGIDYDGDLTGVVVTSENNQIVMVHDADSSMNYEFGYSVTLTSCPCTDMTACNYEEAGACNYDCYGCMDNSAANYDSSAELSIGDIDGDGNPDECLYCDAGTLLLILEMTDSAEDTWNQAMYYITDVNGVNNGVSAGGIVAEGSLETAFSGDGVSVGTDLICLVPGCYTVQVTGGLYPGQVGVTLSDQVYGTIYGTLGGDSTLDMDFLLTGSCAYAGCISTSAINFDINATIDDGSCQEPPANDQLSNAEALACDLDEPYFTGTLLYATDDQDLIGSTFGQADVETAGVWYVYNAAYDKQVVVSTCDTPSNVVGENTDYAVNTQLHVYTMGFDGSLNAISSNNNGCGVDDADVESTLSSAAFNTVAAVDYYIYVSKNLGTEGNDFVLSVNCTDNCATDDDGMAIYPSNDDCVGAQAQVNGITFTGSTCCASAEALPIWTAGNQTAYGVWYTFNSSNYNGVTYDTFSFNITNIGNDVLGFMMMEGNDCDNVEDWIGCEFTEVCAGDVSTYLSSLEPDVDYYFLIYTPEPESCGEFQFTTTGIILGCTDDTASNYNVNASVDNGSCEYEDIDGNVVAPTNDTCDNAIELTCNSTTTGSTGGSTATGAPAGLANCQASPGAGVWYTFVGDGQLHNLSTCGSAINSQMSVYSAEVACGGGSVVIPEADACGDGSVTINYTVGGGSWDGEISWQVLAADGSIVIGQGDAGTVGALVGTICLPEGDYTLNMFDAYGDGWNGASASFTNALGNVVAFGEGAYMAGVNGPAGSVDFTVSAYSMEPILQAGDFTCVEFATGSDGTGECDFYNQDDVNLEFVSEVGVLYYVYVGSQGFSSSFDLVFDCAPLVEGCMNDFACNYDATANSDLGCDFHSCICANDTGVAIQINMNDSYGDGWQGQVYSITDSNGDVVASGDIDNAQYIVMNNNGGPEYGIDMLCLEPGCYFFDISSGGFNYEVSWDIEMADGSILLSGGSPDSQPFTIGGGSVCGCTNSIAENYDVLATSDDGSCIYIEGCTNADACNYDVLVTLDDSSCCFTNCISMNMFDAYGDGWNGGTYVLSTFDGIVIGEGTAENMGGFGNAGSAGTDSYCLESGCYTLDVIGSFDSDEMSWTIIGSYGGIQSGGADQSVTFNVGSGDECVVGCFVSCACNYDPSVNIIDDAQCVYDGCDGCTYLDATNYAVGSVNDDGSCVFEIANSCPADLNGDGSITTGDLLLFLGAFGSICE